MGGLSFDNDDDEDGDDPFSSPPEKKRKKNPHVDTSFLPDRDRDFEEMQTRKKLQKEWYDAQEEIKTDEIEITYSYWDGSGHRRSVTVKKGHTVEQFLDVVLRN